VINPLAAVHTITLLHQGQSWASHTVGTITGSQIRDFWSLYVLNQAFPASERKRTLHLLSYLEIYSKMCSAALSTVQRPPPPPRVLGVLEIIYYKTLTICMGPDCRFMQNLQELHVNPITKNCKGRGPQLKLILLKVTFNFCIAFYETSSTFSKEPGRFCFIAMSDLATLKNVSATNFIKMGFAPNSYPSGQYVFPSW
jgi:hypothetical protein